MILSYKWPTNQPTNKTKTKPQQNNNKKIPKQTNKPKPKTKTKTKKAPKQWKGRYLNALKVSSLLSSVLGSGCLPHGAETMTTDKFNILSLQLHNQRCWGKILRKDFHLSGLSHMLIPGPVIVWGLQLPLEQRGEWKLFISGFHSR